mmetsp:Transcript_6946/g.17492  ORF Transcript_6946/g.17492 Transcript_6946/m.17492 type:complete len:125 (-) Transcript_6946:4-378(-)
MACATCDSSMPAPFNHSTIGFKFFLQAATKELSELRDRLMHESISRCGRLQVCIDTASDERNRSGDHACELRSVHGTAAEHQCGELVVGVAAPDHQPFMLINGCRWCTISTKLSWFRMTSFKSL